LKTVKTLTRMSDSYLLDTNIIIGLFANDANIVKQIAEARRVVISATVIGELYYGAHNSTKVEANVLKIEQFSQDIEVLMCDKGTATHYGQIKYLLKKWVSLYRKMTSGLLPLPNNIT
jgi:tRNA(fMet)-specific endonuclease VapC